MSLAWFYNSMAANFLSYLFLKCNPHKPIFRIRIFMDGTGRYCSEINKSRSRIKAALDYISRYTLARLK